MMDWPRGKGNGEEGVRERGTRKEASRGLGECILERQEERNRGLGGDNHSFLQILQQTFKQPRAPDPGNEGLAVQHAPEIRALMELLASAELATTASTKPCRITLRVPGYVTERTRPHSKEMGKSREGLA